MLRTSLLQPGPGYLRVPLKGIYKGTIRVPLKGSIRVSGFRKFVVPYFGVLTMRILLFRVLYSGPPIFGNSHLSGVTGLCLGLRFRVQGFGFGEVLGINSCGLGLGLHGLDPGSGFRGLGFKGVGFSGLMEFICFRVNAAHKPELSDMGVSEIGGTLI